MGQIIQSVHDLVSEFSRKKKKGVHLPQHQFHKLEFQTRIVLHNMNFQTWHITKCFVFITATHKSDHPLQT